MRVLIDECVPSKFKDHLSCPAVEFVTVPEAGLAGMKNGDLLNVAEGSFEAFITLDKGFQYQQNLSNRRIAIVLLQAPSNRLLDLLPLVPDCVSALQNLKPGQFVVVRS